MSPFIAIHALLAALLIVYLYTLSESDIETSSCKVIWPKTETRNILRPHAWHRRSFISLHCDTCLQNTTDCRADNNKGNCNWRYIQEGWPRMKNFPECVTISLIPPIVFYHKIIILKCINICILYNFFPHNLQGHHVLATVPKRLSRDAVLFLFFILLRWLWNDSGSNMWHLPTSWHCLNLRMPKVFWRISHGSPTYKLGQLLGVSLRVHVCVWGGGGGGEMMRRRGGVTVHWGSPGKCTLSEDVLIRQSPLCLIRQL